MSSWPIGAGEMASRIRAFPWDRTALGPIESWPGPLRTAVDIVLTSGFAAMVMWGPDRIQIYNDGYMALAGDRHPCCLGRPRADDRADPLDLDGPDLESVWAGATVTRVVNRPCKGTEARFSQSYSPLHNDRGGVDGILAMIVEMPRPHVTWEAEAEGLRQFAQASSDVLWIRDARTLRIEYVSPAFDAVYGTDPSGLLGRAWLDHWLDLVHEDDRDAARHALSEVREGRPVTLEFRIVRPTDGQIRWVQNTDFPLRDAAGRVQRIAGIAKDVTDRRETAARMQSLVAELQHRTRNLIGVVRAVSERTAADSNSLEMFRARFNDRLAALARVNGLLSRLQSVDRVGFDELIRSELSAMGLIEGEGQDQRIVLEGPEGIRLRSSTLQTFALALHELAKNALECGGLAHPNGRLHVGWALIDADPPRLQVHWRETAAPDASPPLQWFAQSGFGRYLLEKALPYQLQADVTHGLGAGWLHCTITVPLSLK